MKTQRSIIPFIEFYHNLRDCLESNIVEGFFPYFTFRNIAPV